MYRATENTHLDQSCEEVPQPHLLQTLKCHSPIFCSPRVATVDWRGRKSQSRSSNLKLPCPCMPSIQIIQSTVHNILTQLVGLHKTHRRWVMPCAQVKQSQQSVYIELLIYCTLSFILPFNVLHTDFTTI